jgi:predicted NUDIX family NTP pyrophosphohydrolase
VVRREQRKTRSQPIVLVIEGAVVTPSAATGEYNVPEDEANAAEVCELTDELAGIVGGADTDLKKKASKGGKMRAWEALRE